MLKATAGKLLPTTITGSLPRPSWYTENLGLKSFLDAMVISRFREQCRCIYASRRRRGSTS
jgi:5-methyltetrahydropteroyltriglutamate--homocysteine methyltransferase